MRKWIVALAILLSGLRVNAQSTWTSTGIPSTAGRYDDIFFINDSTGWAVGGDFKIFHTSNGGSAWEEQFSPKKYLRSVKFLTDKLGFCGSLDSSLYRTTDAGKTWTDIASSISPRPVGFCGLASPDSMTIYGCGIWHSPAYLIRSTDQGKTWTYFDMSAYASALVDMVFTSRDTGFAVGTANPSTDGGIILRTTNGGLNWQILHKTWVTDDIIWKIQSPDGRNYFASISANPISGNTRILKSTDGGINWNTLIIKQTFEHLQLIGFIDSLKGWTGDSHIYETKDGGKSWEWILPNGSGFNRFFLVNGRVAYLSAGTIYKQTFKTVTPVPPIPPPTENHVLKIMPNPTPGNAIAEIVFSRSTFASLAMYSSDGKRIAQLFHEYIQAGKKNTPFNLSAYPSGVYFMVLRTNEGLIYQQIVKR